MINLFVKGFFIGVGKVLPGVSGSMLAISFGIYDKIIEIIAHPFKNIKNNISFMFPICIGFLVAIFITSNFLEYIFLKYYTVFMFCFMGIIFRGIVDLKNEIKITIKNLIIILISLLFIMSLNFISNGYYEINYNFFTIFIIGIIEAISSIVPGISGTAIFMILGCYDFILELFSHYFLLSYIKYIIPFVLGIIFGFIMISRIINYLIKNNKSALYSSIMGFTIGSIILLILKFRIDSISSLIFGIICFILSFTLLKID